MYILKIKVTTINTQRNNLIHPVNNNLPLPYYWKDYVLNSNQYEYRLVGIYYWSWYVQSLSFHLMINSSTWKSR